MAKTAQKVNLFTKAKANPVKASGPATQAAIPTPIKGLEEYAFANALKTQIESTMKVGLRPNIDSQMLDHFIKNRGETFNAIEDKATATMIPAKRSSASGLKEDELSLCEKYKIPTAYVEGDFKLNVAGVSEEKLQEVSDAIAKVKGLPANFIEFDASKARTIVTPESVDAVFLINDVDVQKQLLKVVLSPMIKAKTTAKMKRIIESVSALLLEDEEA